MARVADYGIVSSGSISLGSKGSTMSKVIPVTLPANLHQGSSSILQYVIRDVDVGDIFKARITINGKAVSSLSYDDLDFGLDRMVQKVVGKNILKAGMANNFTFEVMNEVDPGGKLVLSDVVIWFQADT